MNSTTVRRLLVRGMLAGLAAGVLALLVAYFLGEPQVDSAIAYEDAQSAGAGHDHGAAGHDHGAAEEEPLVSRDLQATAGLATGILVYGVAFGGLAALAYCYALGRIGRFTPRATALLLAVAGLVAVYVVPFLKYPANPPAVGADDSVGRRTTLYLLMLVLSVLLTVGAVILGQRLAPRLGNWNATVAAGAFLVLVVGLAFAFLPSVNEMPEDFPATVVWKFRVAALAVQATLWTAFGLLFGELAERVLAPDRRTTAREAAARDAVSPG
ncbi:CbtA family protein [Streptomyces sp. NPDC127068]|uniref:CbtA family protein n=1 Tax=Streptomyces sp. NPDC127068 TaxID=3347127 RepID=UPI00365025EF